MPAASNARNCFSENVRLFGDARTEPEKYNLYNGLFNLATAVKELQEEVHRLKNEVDYLRRKS